MEDGGNDSAGMAFDGQAPKTPPTKGNTFPVNTLTGITLDQSRED